MSWIFVDKEKGGGEMRSSMRRNMRSGYSPNMRSGDGYEHGYRMGYKHGWEDHEEEMDDMDYRRSRDSRGRYV